MESFEEGEEVATPRRPFLVSALLTDRFGAVGIEAFESLSEGRRAYAYGSPMYAHVLYERREVEAEKEEEDDEKELRDSWFGPTEPEEAAAEQVVVIGSTAWVAAKRYGSRKGTEGIAARARRLLAGAALGDVVKNDISRDHLTGSTASGTFRAVTLPFRLSGSAAKAAWRQKMVGPKRPTWNSGYEAAVTVLRSAAQNVPRNISVMRFLTDVSIPGAFLPGGLLRATENLRWKKKTKQVLIDQGGKTTPQSVREEALEIQEIEWVWPKKLTPRLSAGHLSLASEIKDNKQFCEKELAPLLRDGLLAEVPVILYLHGGAFALCGRGTHRELTFRMALAADAVVCVPEYRRPPDATLAETLADAERAYERILSCGVKPNRIIFAGDSAGGGLALSLMCALRDHRPTKELPAGCVLLSPWVDLDEFDDPEAPFHSRNANQAFDFLPRDLIDLFANTTITSEKQKQQGLGKKASSSGAQEEEEEISGQEEVLPPQGGEGPESLAFKRCHSCAESLRDLPPMLLLVGQCEVLLDQVLALGRHLERVEGADHHCLVFRDMVHVSSCFASFHDNPRRQLDLSGAFVRAAVARPRSARERSHDSLDPLTNDDMRMTRRVGLRVQVEAAFADVLAKTTATFLALGTATVAARLANTGDTPWQTTDPCRLAKNDDNHLSFFFGGNGGSSTIVLKDPPRRAPVIVEIQVRCATVFGQTKILASTTTFLPTLDLDAPANGLENLDLDGAAGHVNVAVNLVSDAAFVLPNGTIVDHKHRHDVHTSPPRDLPVVDQPLRLHFPKKNRRQHMEEDTTKQTTTGDDPDNLSQRSSSADN